MNKTGIISGTKFENSPPGATRKWVRFSCQIEGEYYSIFIDMKNRATFESVKDGDEVSINYEVKGNYKNIIDLVVSKKQAVAASVANAPIEMKERRITWAAAAKLAIPFVEFCIAQGYLPLPTKKQDQADAFFSHVVEYAGRFSEVGWQADFNTELPELAQAVKEPEVANGVE